MHQVYLEYLGDSVELPIGETIIGRDVGCALRFNDPAVSRRHLRFVRRDDEVFVEDLSSSNGTVVNGRKLTDPRRVRDGDTIRVGSRMLTLHVMEADNLGESTLLLKNLEVEPERSKMRAVTAQMVVQLPPVASYQRCPRCSAPVTDLDDECATCNYQWGDFRPMTVTAVRPSPLNRRRHDRQSIELSLVYVSAALEIEAMTRDLSESGVFVCTEVLEPLGTACHLTILVDGGPPLRVGGIVRRVIEHGRSGGELTGLGVEFVGIGENELAWIKSVVARMTTDDDDQPID